MSRVRVSLPAKVIKRLHFWGRFCTRSFLLSKSPQLEREAGMLRRRLMVFIDGENLVFRYQSMLKGGRTPIANVVHEPDVFVWRKSVTTNGDYDMLRATYYTYAVGDDLYISSIQEKIKNLPIHNEYTTTLPNKLTPMIFKKEKRAAKSKGVDIQLTVDVLSHVYNNTTDAVFILTGDGDYEPLFKEVLRRGKQLYLAAFSEGFNPRLLNLADHFYYLDDSFFVALPK